MGGTGYENRVAIIGAGGHIGLPLSVVMANAGYDVTGIDVNRAVNAMLSRGEVPYVEYGAAPLLRRALDAGKLRYTDSYDALATSDVLVIIVGTPVDDNLNPRIDPLLRIFEEHSARLPPGQLIVLRSTVSPGTTELLRKIIEKQTGRVEGRDYHLVFAPERVLQTRAVEEIRSLPQLVGAFNTAGFERAQAFFERFVDNRCIRLDPVEAELGKLITNMSRYISFAVANEFYLICDTHGARAHRVIEACNMDYPRLNLPRPGPNVGGPCLYKDGYYLTDKIPYSEIIGAAFKINEYMPSFLIEKARRAGSPLHRAGILGMTFKANCDDTRNSLSFKLKKKLRCIACDPVEVDPYVAGCEDPSRLRGVDALFLMTPHHEFADLAAILASVDNPECVIVDMWNFWRELEVLAGDGAFTARQALRVLEVASIDVQAESAAAMG